MSGSDQEAAGGTVFSEAWWLDAVAPGRWGVATVGEGDLVVGRLPWAEERLPVRGLHVRRLGTPRLTPHLVPELELGSGKQVTRLAREHTLLDRLISALPPFDYLSYTFPPSFTNWLPFAERGFTATLRVTYVLDGIADLDAVAREMSSECRKAIRKAEKLVAVESDQRPERLNAMLAATFARQGRSCPWPPELLERIVAAVVDRDRGEVITAVDGSGRPHASLLLVHDAGRSYYLAGGADAELRSSGAHSLLLWEAIRRSAERADTFDFEGSMIPSVARFFRGFGSRPVTYVQITGTSRRMRAALAAADLGKAVLGRR